MHITLGTCLHTYMYMCMLQTCQGLESEMLVISSAEKVGIDIASQLELDNH